MTSAIAHCVYMAVAPHSTACSRSCAARGCCTHALLVARARVRGSRYAYACAAHVHAATMGFTPPGISTLRAATHWPAHATPPFRAPPLHRTHASRAGARSPAATVGFMPSLVFPFVKLHAAGATSGHNEQCFEMLATLLMNWTRGACVRLCGLVCSHV